MTVNYEGDLISIKDLKFRIDELSEKLEKESKLEDYEQEELDSLLDIREQLDWCWEDDGEELVAEHFFTDYAKCITYELGEVKEGSFICHYVDWERAASHLLQDYRTVKLQGLTFYIRDH